MKLIADSLAVLWFRLPRGDAAIFQVDEQTSVIRGRRWLADVPGFETGEGLSVGALPITDGDLVDKIGVSRIDRRLNGDRFGFFFLFLGFFLFLVRV